MTNRFLTLALVACFALSCEEALPETPGARAPGEPYQRALDQTEVFLRNEWRIRPLAEFELEALVLGQERYRFDAGADLAPVDLALGWGPMSDPSIAAQFDISQHGRFYYWRVDAYPIPRKQIIRSSANMHMIPADDDVRETLLSIDRGDVIALEGFLVSATTESGRIWKSSLTRKDSGAGACEVVWVKSVRVLPS